MDPTWDAWFDANAPALILFARPWTASHSDAEDVVQEAFVRFWRVGRHRAQDPKAYLFATVKRVALDSRRSELRRERRESEVVRNRAPNEPVFETTVERDEWRDGVEAALASLPESQREVLVLKVWGNLTFPQIAEVTGVSSNTAASRFRYGLEALRKALVKDVEVQP